MIRPGPRPGPEARLSRRPQAGTGARRERRRGAWMAERSGSRRGSRGGVQPGSVREAGSRSALLMPDRRLTDAEPPERFHEELPDRLEALRRAGLEAHHQRGLRVRGSHQAPTVTELDARAIDVDDAIAAGELALDLLDDLELPLVGAGEPGFGGGVVVGDRVHQLRERAASGGDVAQEPPGREQRVVEAEEALAEEHVAGHLARERGAGLLQAALDERVAGLPHRGPAAVRRDVL